MEFMQRKCAELPSGVAADGDSASDSSHGEEGQSSTPQGWLPPPGDRSRSTLRGDSFAWLYGDDDTRRAPRKPDAVVPAGGSALAPAVRREMETSFGADFSNVRVHEDPERADALDAEAYTVGRDIVFNSGRYAPHTNEGRHRLAHELTHVVQQANGAVDGTDRGDGVALSHPSDRFEQAAEATADRVAAGHSVAARGGSAAGLSAAPSSGPSVQRQVVQREEKKDEDPAGDSDGSARPPVSADPAVQLAEAQRDAEREQDAKLGLPAAAPTDPTAPSGADKQAQSQMRTREEMAKRLEVIPETHTGARLPNQVTPSEFDDVTARQADVPLGRNDLKLGFNADPALTPEEKSEYNQGTMDDLYKMGQVPTGRQTIEQLTTADGKTTTVELARAGAAPATENGPDPACGPPSKNSEPGGPGEPGAAQAYGEDNKPPAQKQNATIRYVPGEEVPVPSSEPTNPDGTGPTPSHAVLFHEGQHAVDITSGKLDTRPMTQGDGDAVDVKGQLDYCGPKDANGQPTTRAPIINAEKTAVEAERRYREEHRINGEDLPDRPRYYQGDAGNLPTASDEQRGRR